MTRYLILAGLLGAAVDGVAAKRVLYLTHSAGYRHDSIRPSIRALQDIANRTGKLEIVATEDLSTITAANLDQYDAVFFFTSGELAFSDSQKRDLLDFVRRGKGFGGTHSATDTLYGWTEYGELIGGVFDGHPWVHEATVDIEDPDFPGLDGVAPSFRMVEEFYQFRGFSRDRVRVLMTLDPSTINLQADGVNRTDNDFALAWVRPFGQGRVFYTALGHFDETWTDPRFQKMLEGALLWLTGEVEADATPRATSRSLRPSLKPLERQAPGAVIQLSGENLTSGSTFEARRTPLPLKLAGTRVELNGRPLPLFSVSPATVVAQLPFDLTTGTAELTVWSATLGSAPLNVAVAEAAPVIVAAARAGGALVVYATGLGAVEGAGVAGSSPPGGTLLRTRVTPELLVNGAPGAVFYSGLAPALVGVYQVNAMPAGQAAETLELQIRAAGAESNRFVLR